MRLQEAQEEKEAATQEHELMAHLRALKKFMLLGQGDFVTCLMDTLGSELCSPARDMYRVLSSRGVLVVNAPGVAAVL